MNGWLLRAASTTGFVLAIAGASRAAAPSGTPDAQSWLAALKDVRIVGSPGSRPMTALPLSSPPIGGFAPRVVFGLTDEQDPDDLTFESHASSVPGGNTLPIGSAPSYFIATLDTGAQSHIVRYADSLVFDLASADRLGNHFQEITGANGSESSDISDGLGIYMTGFANASVSGGSTINATGTLKGQWNTSILTTLPGSSLPNIVGSPMIAQHQAVIRNTQTRHLTVGGQTYRTPQVDFQPLNTALPAGYSRLTLDVLSGNGVSPNPVFFPSLDNMNNWADNPATPSFWASLFARVNGSHTAGTISQEQFLFDTGAEVTVLSEDTAAQVGFFTGGPNPSTPDFFVEVQGVGGTAIDVPGFYMNSMSITTNGGPITWTNVPVIVLNLPDPRDFVGFVPGILGMNLFTDRDLVINGGTGNPFVGISPIWEWATNSSGNWSDSTKWTLAVPNGIDSQANFYGKITAPQTVTVDGAGFSVGTMNFDNANRYTIAGPGAVTLQVSVDQAQINVLNGSHTISAPVTLASDTVVTVVPPAGKLTISSDVAATGRALIKAGPGALEMKNVRAASLEISAGRVEITSNGSNSGTSKLSALTIATGAGATARLDLANNGMVIDYAAGNSPAATIHQYLANGYAGGAWNGSGGIISSLANASTLALGFTENTANLPQFGGQSADATSLLMRLTRYGDADVSGAVDSNDFNALASNFGLAGRFWFHGDFNFNGTVNSDDFNLLAANFGLSATGPSGEVTPQDWANLAAAVPEPAAAASLAAAMLTALLMRGRRLCSEARA